MKMGILRPACRTIVRAAAAVMLFAACLAAQSQNPVIIIPGLTGSKLVNKNNGMTVWFRITKSKTDDLRLPISTDISHMRDSLVPADILREVKIRLLPTYDIYGGLVKSLVERGNYHEETWDVGRGAPGAVYVFAYDWRLDNVQNARLLMRKIAALKLRLRKPGLKFDIIAHSMGGIIARYAAMYGNAPLGLGTRKYVPTWAGARDLDKVVLLGTPNEGSVLAMTSLFNGLRLGGIKLDLPFVRYMSKFDVFTIPSSFQLLPAPGTLHAYDENLKPLLVDLYDPATWAKYGWDVFGEKGYDKAFTPAEQAITHKYFTTVLDRARRIYEALNVESKSSKAAVPIYLLGSDCKDTLDSVVLIEDKDTKKWKTLFKPSGFTTGDGQKVAPDDIKKVMFAPGDGTVARRSFEASPETPNGSGRSVLMPKSNKFVCEEHDRLQANGDLQNEIITILTGHEPVVTDRKAADKDKLPRMPVDKKPAQ
jgi:pimeloyl-ACP methyl ester carboxylesterase